MIRPALAAAALIGSMGMAMAQDVSAGAAIYAQRCVVCHAIGPDAPSKVGPPLNGIVGSLIGGQDGFPYSAGMNAARGDGEVWSEDKLRHYLRSPKKLFPGTKMAFAGMRDDTAITDMIAYLGSINADGTSQAD